MSGAATTKGARTTARSELPEQPGHLWLLALSPAVWALHFLACYATAAIWCAKAGAVAAPGATPLGPARVAVAAYTVVALAAIAANAWHAGRRMRRMRWRGEGAEDRPQAGSRLDFAGPHDADTPADRERFLALATLLLSGLGFVATVFTALAAVFIGDCR